MNIGLIGCGAMGYRHSAGYRELREAALADVDLVTVCDVNEASARYVANSVAEWREKAPRVYTGLEAMLDGEADLDAVDIVTTPHTHHTLACAAMDAGWHVMVEKPIALTIAAAHRMLETARRTGRTLAVMENYRRDPQNRLAKALVESGAIGTPRYALQLCMGDGNRASGDSLWRHQRTVGGIIAELGVHFTDMLRYFVGPVERVHAMTRQFEAEREIAGNFAPRPTSLRADPVGTRARADAEDAVVALWEFASGALGHLTIHLAAHGGDAWMRRIYGSTGTLFCPGDRRGDPVTLAFDDGTKVEGPAALELASDFTLEPALARLFPGWEGTYDLPFGAIDHKLIAYEIWDFADAVATGRPPEVDGQEGLEAFALIQACCEAGLLRQPVRVADVRDGRIAADQADLNAVLGL